MTDVSSPSNKLKLIFAGTPDFAANTLKTIIDSDKYHVIAAYSQPDRRSGRGKKTLPTPVKQVALDHDIPVYQPLTFKSEEGAGALAELQALNADIMVVVAYGMLLPESVLNTPRYGCLNVHASILPRWRGAAPIERAIEAQDTETGVTIMQMDIGLDTGNMLNIVRLPITDKTTGDSLRAELCDVGSTALLETLDMITTHHQNGTTPDTGAAQDDALANYAKKLTKQEAELDFNQPVQTLLAKIRAFNSSNVCFSHVEMGGAAQRIKIWDAEVITSENPAKPAGTIVEASKKGLDVVCGDGSIRLTKIQLPNAKAMDVAAVLNGKKDDFLPGTQFGPAS